MILTNLTFLIIFSIIYISGLSFLYFSRSRLDNKENRVYKIMLISNIVGLILQLLCDFVSYNYFNMSRLVSDFILKAYLIYFIFFASMMLYYLFVITVSSSSNYSKMMKVAILLFSIAIIVLPISLYRDEVNRVYYSYGLAVTGTFVISSILSSIMIFLLIINRKKINKKKSISIYVFLSFALISMIIQMIRPELVITCAMESFVCCLMYFTIENPDVQMLNELYKNRELMEQGYEDKYNFLFEMTQDAKKPLLDLNRVSNELRQEDDPKKVKEGLMAINNLTRQLDFAINEVLNVSSFDIQKLKIVNTKYDVLKVCDGLNTTMKGEIKKGVTFNMDLPKSVPTLYGDYMKLRQILYSLLNNASKNTDDGSINLRLNVIEKYDFCRLIFNISDTGKGMSIEKINEILSATGELDKKELEILEKKEFNFKVCQKVVKIMGGNLMIKSAVGAGTDITLTLDQRVYHEKEDSVMNQYESAISTSKRVLIVAQNKDLSTFIKNRLNANSITYSALAFGGDAADRLKAGKSYDYILIEDEMKEMSGLATLQALQAVKGFDIPTIIMLHEDKERIAKAYISDGFSDYLVIDRLDEELKRIIDKY
jgi:signal transduction histidine kinase